MVSNLECRTVHGDENLVDVHSCLTVHEQRRERKQLYVGRQFHRLERLEDEWKIRYASFCSSTETCPRATQLSSCNIDAKPGSGAPNN